MTERQVHHSAICVRDVDESLRFYRDGLGLAVFMDQAFDGDWPTLFDASTSRLRSVMLGDPEARDSGVVELVAFEHAAGERVERWRTPTVRHEGPPDSGFFLLSLFLDVDAALARLAALGLGGEPRRVSQPAPNGMRVPMATVRDPDGVLVELIGAPA